MVFAAWVLFAVLLTILFSQQLQRQRNPNQQIQSESLPDGYKQVVLRRNRAGHYIATGSINGALVEFLLDTGATNVAVPERVATQLGLSRGVPLKTHTANGVITTYATTLDHVSLGDIYATGVAASINPNMLGNQILLGMSFLKRFEIFQRGNQLTIRSAEN